MMLALIFDLEQWLPAKLLLETPTLHHIWRRAVGRDRGDGIGAALNFESRFVFSMTDSKSTVEMPDMGHSMARLIASML